MKNVLDIFEERGFVEQTTDPQLLRDLLEGSATCYIGFDPTAKSFHVGSLLPIMALVHMQKAGHRPIAVIGGGTGLVGDPSGKTETRPILTREEIDRNAQALKNQLSRFISFADDGAIMVNNADWLTNLNYIEFLRDIGRHFSVNRMLAAESYKAHKGAVWLDPVLTSPYDYYQYWINQGDEDVERFLALFTFLPMDEVRRLGKLEGADLRKAKEILAYEATTICHGREAADEARQAARELFGKGGSVSAKSVPTLELDGDLFEKGVPAYILFEQAGLCKTRGEARRLITQGGGYLNEERITVFDQVIDSSDLKNGELVLRAGKKRYLKITTP
ncbi:MAG: hypothetical protein B1H13_09795 [Desulfobacteraceae bacterium 4484_190.3]|nr:MAG: hypothetical protein B1H13_09795 [Desulfobacteraceae bacterium 4484_190.3]